jgi:hypothetical protein
MEEYNNIAQLQEYPDELEIEEYNIMKLQQEYPCELVSDFINNHEKYKFYEKTPMKILL